MEIWQQTKQSYINSQRELYGKSDPRSDARYCGQIHKNAIAQALGKNELVPNEVLADYKSFDWSTHPACRNRTDLAKIKGVTAGKSGKGCINFYALGCLILSEGMTGIGDDK